LRTVVVAGAEEEEGAEVGEVAIHSQDSAEGVAVVHSRVSGEAE